MLASCAIPSSQPQKLLLRQADRLVLCLLWSTLAAANLNKQKGHVCGSLTKLMPSQQGTPMMWQMHSCGEVPQRVPHREACQTLKIA